MRRLQWTRRHGRGQLDMALALSIETSSRIGSIALADDDRVLIEDEFQHGLANAAQIVPIIDRALRKLDRSPADVKDIYISAGPGSFTGLRIGITLAKTMALATGAKLVAVPTARVLVENAPTEARHVVLVLDAKRDQIFTARFERDASSSHWIEREPAHLDTLSSMIERSPRPVHLLGEGIPYHEKFISQEKGDVIAAPAELWRPRAGVVAMIGRAMARDGRFTEPDALVPIYLRKPEAQEKYESGHRPKT